MDEVREALDEVATDLHLVDEPCDGFHAANAWGPCAKCGLMLEAASDEIHLDYSPPLSGQTYRQFYDWLAEALGLPDHEGLAADRLGET